MRILKFIFLYVLFFNFYGFSQNDTIIFYGSNNKKADSSNAVRYTKISSLKKNKLIVNSYIKIQNNWIQTFEKKTVYFLKDSSVKIVSVFNKKIKDQIIRKYKRHGSFFYFQDFNENGKLKQEGHTTSIFPLHLEGEIKNYFVNGNISSISIYENNQLKSNKNWLENGEKYIDNIFSNVDKSPEFPGGIDALINKMHKEFIIPDRVLENNIQGIFYVKFVIDENGNMIGVHTIKSLDNSLDKEVKRIFSTLKEIWSVGMLDGEPVKVVVTIPFKITIN